MTHPVADPFHFYFSSSSDSEINNRSWGEVIAAYSSPAEAKFFRQDEPQVFPLILSGIDNEIASHAIRSTEHQIQKKSYADLVTERGKGHLLVVLDSPFASFQIFKKVEHRLVGFLLNHCSDETPFRFFWVAYRFKGIGTGQADYTSCVYTANAQRNNFFKCIFDLETDPRFE